MTRQTTLDLKPDQVGPGESKVGDSLGEEKDTDERNKAKKSVQFSEPPEQISHQNWRPDFDNNFLITEKLDQQDENAETLKSSISYQETAHGSTFANSDWSADYDNSSEVFNSGQEQIIMTANSNVEKRSVSFAMNDEDDNAVERQADKDWSSEFDESPHVVRLLDKDNEEDTNPDSDISPKVVDDSLEWKSVYDKSEMMYDSDYQKAIETSEDEANDNDDNVTSSPIRNVTFTEPTTTIDYKLQTIEKEPLDKITACMDEIYDSDTASSTSDCTQMAVHHLNKLEEKDRDNEQTNYVEDDYILGPSSSNVPTAEIGIENHASVLTVTSSSETDKDVRKQLKKVDLTMKLDTKKIKNEVLTSESEESSISENKDEDFKDTVSKTPDMKSDENKQIEVPDGATTSKDIAGEWLKKMQEEASVLYSSESSEGELGLFPKRMYRQENELTSESKANFEVENKETKNPKAKVGKEGLPLAKKKRAPAQYSSSSDDENTPTLPTFARKLELSESEESSSESINTETDSTATPDDREEISKTRDDITKPAVMHKDEEIMKKFQQQIDESQKLLRDQFSNTLGGGQSENTVKMSQKRIDEMQTFARKLELPESEESSSESINTDTDSTVTLDDREEISRTRDNITTPAIVHKDDEIMKKFREQIDQSQKLLTAQLDKSLDRSQSEDTIESLQERIDEVQTIGNNAEEEVLTANPNDGDQSIMRYEEDDEDSDEDIDEIPEEELETTKNDVPVIKHEPEPDLMDRLNHLLGRTLNEIKSADDSLEKHKESMEKTDEILGHKLEDNDEKFFDNRESDESSESSDDEPETGLLSGHKDYSFSDSDNEIVEDDRINEGDKQLDETESHNTEIKEPIEKVQTNYQLKEREEWLESMGRMRFKSVSTKIEKKPTRVESAEILSHHTQVDDTKKDDEDEKTHVLTNKLSGSESDADSDAATSFTSSSSSSSGSDWSRGESPRRVDAPIAVALENIPSDTPAYKGIGKSSDAKCKVPVKPPSQPRSRERPSSAQIARRQDTIRVRPQPRRPMSAQIRQEQVPLKQYHINLTLTSERPIPRGKRVSGTLYKYEPIDNEQRLRQKFNELFEIVESTQMSIGKPTRSPRLSPPSPSPRVTKSTKPTSTDSRSRSSSEEGTTRSTEDKSRRNTRRTPPSTNDNETDIDIDDLNKQLTDKYKELETLMCKRGEAGQGHRLVQRQMHQAILLMQKTKPKMKADPNSKMDGYEYNLPPRAPYSNGIPSRDDPRSRSFSPTDHNLRNSDNPVIRDWLRHKERCLRIQRSEERQKRREDKNHEKTEDEAKAERLLDGSEKVDDWMKRKKRESRRLLKFRNNKENFVNLGRPQSARPEIVMTTTSLEFKRPTSAAVHNSRSAEAAPPRPRSAVYKPKVKRDDEQESESQALKNDRRRISYEQWLSTKRKEDDAKRQEEVRRIDELRRTYQDNDIDKIIPDLARNRIKLIETTKKRVDSGYKRSNDDTNVPPKSKPQNGTQGVKMYKWRPSSAVVSSSSSSKDLHPNKYQLIRPPTTDFYDDNPYRSPNPAPRRPASSRPNRPRYVEHIWTDFSDNVWKQVNENERPEPMGECQQPVIVETHSKVNTSESAVHTPGFNIEGHGPVAPLGSTKPVIARTSNVPEEGITQTAVEKAATTSAPNSNTVRMAHPAEKKTFMTDCQTESVKVTEPSLTAVTSNGINNPSTSQMPRTGATPPPKQTKAVSFQETNFANSTSSSFLEHITNEQEKHDSITKVDSNHTVNNHISDKTATKTVSFVEKTSIENGQTHHKENTTTESINNYSANKPIISRTEQTRYSENLPPTEEVVTVSKDFEPRDTSVRRRGSILKATNGTYDADSGKKKKKSVTFNPYTDTNEKSASSDSDQDRVSISSYRGDSDSNGRSYVQYIQNDMF